MACVCAALLVLPGAAPVLAQDNGPSSESCADTDGVPVTDGAEDGQSPAECEAPPPPPPPQVSLANLASPAPAALDLDLREALTDIGFLDTWYAITPTHPRLSLVAVSDPQADGARQVVLDSADELTEIRETVARLYRAIQDSIARRHAVERDIAGIEARIASLEAERDQTQGQLDGLMADHQMVVKALRNAAVGLYTAEQQATVSGMDDISSYNAAQELDVQVDATIDELLAQRDDLELGIETAQNRVREINSTIAAQQRDRLAMLQVVANITDAIERLSEEVARLTTRRLEIEADLPLAIGEAHRTRLLASAPNIGASLVVLDSYVRAAEDVTEYRPNCSIRWEILAGVATIESAQGTFGGATVGANGDINRRILGPVLDGTLEGTAVIGDSDAGRLDGNSEYDRAVGPFQFLPSTWGAFGLDSTGDNFANPHNMYDAALSAAGYLCAQSNVADDGGIERSILTYNNSRVYLADVTGVARNYIRALALPEAAYDPEDLEVRDGWRLAAQSDEWEQIGQIGPFRSGVSGPVPFVLDPRVLQNTGG